MRPAAEMGVPSPTLQEQLGASFALARALLQTEDEEGALLAAMQVSAEFIGAVGCSFLPLQEWTTTLRALKYGDADFLQDLQWQSLLVSPDTRQACRICKRQSPQEVCVLRQNSSGAQQVICVGVRRAGREIGVISYFFSAPLNIHETLHLFLGELVHLLDIALVRRYNNAERSEAVRQVASAKAVKEFVKMQEGVSREALDHLAYTAVLEERTRLAREIHDGLAQTLAFLKIEAGRMQTYLEKGELEVLRARLEACYQTLSTAYLDSRMAIDNLRQIPTGELVEWLTMTGSEFQSITGVPVDVSNVRLCHEFPPVVKLQLVRIIQEALTNVRKHAQACSVTLSAFEENGEAVFEITDNGLGFEPAGAEHVSQYGLRSMRERAESIGASVQITSASESGTTVRLRVPIREKPVHE